MSRWMKLVPVILICLPLLLESPGCGGEPTGPDGSGDPTDVSILPSADRQVLSDGAGSYLTLRDSQSPEAARTALIANLNATEGVSKAELTIDGGAIWVEFDDGQAAAITTAERFGASPTYDASEIKAALEGGGGSARVIGPRDVVPKILSSAKINPGDSPRTPGSRKVLLLSAASEEFAGTDVSLFEYVRDYLVDNHGWDTRDITIKYNRADDDYGTLIFNDFLHLSDYGVIVLCAHSWMLNVPRPLPPRTSLYVQVTGMEPYFDAYGSIGHPDEPFDLADECGAGRVFPAMQIDPFKKSHRFYLYMRDDLWLEHLGALPDSVVYLCIPNSEWLNDAFVSLNPGHTIVWDGIPDSVEDCLNPACLPLFMAKENSTAIEAWDIYMDYLTTVGSATVDLTMRMSGLSKCYMPTWAFVGTRYNPAGTNTVKVEMSYTNTAVPLPETTVVQDLPHVGKEFVDLYPGEEITFKATALDAAENVLAEAEKTTTLYVGKNVVVIDFNAYGIILSADPAWAKPDGAATATVTAVVRTFQAGDTTVPTGSTVPDKQITFSADTWATLVGTNPATTDADGKATIQIKASQEGTATVTARIEEDDVEASTEIEFTEQEPHMYVWLTGSESTSGIAYWGQNEAEHTIQATGFYMVRYLNEKEYNRHYFDPRRPVPLFNDGTMWAEVGDTVKFEFVAEDASEYSPATLGPLYVHYFYQDGTRHKVKSLGSFSSTVAYEEFEVTITLD